MPQSLAALYVHLVFSTKERRPFLRDLDLRDQLHSYIGGICKQCECAPVRVGGVEDHVHVLARLSRTMSPSDWVKEVKRCSSIWLKPHEREFEWQAGYAMFSVSQSNLEQVTEYIAKQPEHHRKMDFQAELRTLLRKHQVEWDEQYVWG